MQIGFLSAVDLVDDDSGMTNESRSENTWEKMLDLKYNQNYANKLAENQARSADTHDIIKIAKHIDKYYNNAAIIITKF